MDGVEIKTVEGVPVVSSVVVAQCFNKRHDNIVRAIDDICREMQESHSSKLRSELFKEVVYVNSRNREYRAYEMTRDGFSLLAMGLTGAEAFAWKLKFISTFNAMEKALCKEMDKLEWKQARLQGKEMRKSVSDAIAEFVEYAKKQGSKNAEKYYSSITRMEYVALELISKSEKVPSKFRDSLDLMQICSLTMAEQLAKKAIQSGMEQGLHYKEIYSLAKQRVIAFSDSVNLPMLPDKK